MKDLVLFNNLSIAMKRIPQVCATIAVNFSKERFIKENWVDRQTYPWKPRKAKKGSNTDNRAILTKTGRLRKSIRKVAVRTDSFTIGSDVPYAKIHNDGGTIEGIEKVNGFTRKAHLRREYTRKGKIIPATTVKAATVSSFNRKYKRKFVKRQFIGQSDALDKKISRSIRTTFRNAIKKSLVD